MVDQPYPTPSLNYSFCHTRFRAASRDLQIIKAIAHDPFPFLVFLGNTGILADHLFFGIHVQPTSKSPSKKGHAVPH
jgi:hypothetical protein